MVESISKFRHGGVRANSGGARAGAGRKPKAAPPAYVDIERWYCVRTRHGAEITADFDIRRAGFTLFSPSLWKPGTPARRAWDGSLRPARPALIVPLFRRYLFVRFRRDADDWRSIAHLPTVDRIFSSTRGQPTPVPDGAIDLIRSLCAPNGCVYPDNERMLDGPAPVIRMPPIAPGTRTRLTAGPMADLAGICTWSDSKRVRLLLEIMGRTVSVTVARADVETV